MLFSFAIIILMADLSQETPIVGDVAHGNNLAFGTNTQENRAFHASELNRAKDEADARIAKLAESDPRHPIKMSKLQKTAWKLINFLGLGKLFFFSGQI